jgi:hypothetical protein
MPNRSQATTAKENGPSTPVGQKDTHSLQGTNHPSLVLQRAYADPGSLSPSDVLTLQRSVGNRATTHLLRPLLQAKLKLGPAGDRYEQEADQVAQQVVRQMQSAPTPIHEEAGQAEIQMKPLASRISTLQRSPSSQKPSQKRTFFRKPAPTIQRREGEDEEELAQMKPLHSAEGGEVETSVEQQIRQSQGGGRSLDAGVRRSMEGAFGADFSGVRVHTDSKADTLNRSLNARAFTTGKDLFFRRGEYNPGNSGGKQLLAHELTHVVQQSGSTPGTAQAQIQRKSDKLKAKSHYTGNAKGGFNWGKATGYDKILNAIADYHSLGPDKYMAQLQQLAKIGDLLTAWEISHGLADTSVNSKDTKETARRGVLATIKSTDLPQEIADVYGQAQTNGGQPDVHLLMQLMDATQGNPGVRGQIESDYATSLRTYQANQQDIQAAIAILNTGNYLGAGSAAQNQLNSVRGLDDDPTGGQWDSSILDAPIQQDDSDFKKEMKTKRRYLQALVPAVATMSDAEIKAIAAYTKEGPYTDMNSVLRGSSTVSGNNKNQRKQNAKLRAEAQQANLMASSGLNRLPNWTGETLFRGERDIAWAGTLTQGRVIVLKSFSSSSVKLSIAKQFASSGSQSAVWEISNVTSQGKDIRDISTLGSQEGEVLLKPYTRLRIDNVSVGNDYAHHIEATAL